MYPPYSGLKVIHDQMVQEAVERSRLNNGHAPHRQSLSQIVEKVLAHFTTHAERKQARTFCEVKSGSSGKCSCSTNSTLESSFWP
jgi:hypothetical protein